VNEKHVCTAEAIYGGEKAAKIGNGSKWETITAYKPCLDPVKIKSGDILTMTALYDTTKHRL
jgi:hypothetical protein